MRYAIEKNIRDSKWITHKITEYIFITIFQLIISNFGTSKEIDIDTYLFINSKSWKYYSENSGTFLTLLENVNHFFFNFQSY